MGPQSAVGRQRNDHLGWNRFDELFAHRRQIRSATNRWTPTSLANVPLGRYVHTAVWTGSEMIVWGGVDESFNETNTGGRYNPSTDSWIATGVANGAPLPRDSHSAVWTGSEMIVWGGESPSTDFNTGGRYNQPARVGHQRRQPTHPFPDLITLRSGPQSNDHLGGLSADTATYLNTGGRYCAQPSTPIAQSAVSRRLTATPAASMSICR